MYSHSPSCKTHPKLSVKLPSGVYQCLGCLKDSRAVFEAEQVVEIRGEATQRAARTPLFDPDWVVDEPPRR